MQALTNQDYSQLRLGAEVLEADSFGEKVLRLRDGNFIKLFRRKRLVSSALFWPYAQRFAANAIALAELGIPSPIILGVYRLHDLQRDVVHYQPVPGLTLRQLRGGASCVPDDLHYRLGQFIAALHQCGIYFRSLHLGNIVLTVNDQFGLIDVADLKKQHAPLNKSKRLRNFRHLLRDAGDSEWLLSKHTRFVEGYIDQNTTGISRPELYQALGLEHSRT